MIERPRYGGFTEGEVPAERSFHEARWDKEAERMNNEALRGILMKVGLKQSATPEDVMYAEAVQDNEQFDKRMSAEYECWDRKFQEVVTDMRAVRDNSDERPKDFKLVLVALGTGLGSGSGTGQNMALDDMGYTDLIDVFVGSSGASGPAAFSAIGDSRIAASLYMDECTTDAFLNKKGMVPKLDTRVIAKAMRNGPKTLNIEKIRNSSKEIYAIATDKETHKAELLDLKTVTPDPVSALEASSAIPFFREAVEVDGKHFYDGAFSQLPLEAIIEKFKPTHLLIQPNVAFNYLQSYDYTGAERAVMWTAAKMGSVASMGTVEEFFRMKENVRGVLEKIGKIHNVKIAVMWPPEEDLHNLTNDPDTMRRAILESYRELVAGFGEKQPQTIRLYPGDMPEMEEADLKKAA